MIRSLLVAILMVHAFECRSIFMPIDAITTSDEQNGQLDSVLKREKKSIMVSLHGNTHFVFDVTHFSPPFWLMDYKKYRLNGKPLCFNFQENPFQFDRTLMQAPGSLPMLMNKLNPLANGPVSFPIGNYSNNSMSLSLNGNLIVLL